jgi:hypothetical protein
MSAQQDAEKFVATLAQLLHDNPGQPVALVERNGEVQLGVMSIIPEADDWCLNPVPVAQIVDIDLKSAA